MDIKNYDIRVLRSPTFYFGCSRVPLHGTENFKFSSNRQKTTLTRESGLKKSLFEQRYMDQTSTRFTTSYAVLRSSLPLHGTESFKNPVPKSYSTNKAEEPDLGQGKSNVLGLKSHFSDPVKPPPRSASPTPSERERTGPDPRAWVPRPDHSAATRHLRSTLPSATAQGISTSTLTVLIQAARPLHSVASWRPSLLQLAPKSVDESSAARVVDTSLITLARHSEH